MEAKTKAITNNQKALLWVEHWHIGGIGNQVDTRFASLYLYIDASFITYWVREMIRQQRSKSPVVNRSWALVYRDYG